MQSCLCWLFFNGVGTSDSIAYAKSANDILNNIIGVSPCAGGSINDPSTEKINAVTKWTVSGTTNEVKIVDYLTRWKNKVLRQTDWSGGDGEEGPLTDPNSNYSNSTGIDETSLPGSIKIQGL